MVSGTTGRKGVDVGGRIITNLGGGVGGQMTVPKFIDVVLSFSSDLIFN